MKELTGYSLKLNNIYSIILFPDFFLIILEDT